MDRFGSRIGKARGRRSRQDIAVAVGVSNSTLQRWEKDENEPNVSDLVKLEQALGVSIQWLATGEEEVARLAGREDGPKQKGVPPPNRKEHPDIVMEITPSAENESRPPEPGSIQNKSPFLRLELQGEEVFRLDLYATGRAEYLRLPSTLHGGGEDGPDVDDVG